MASMPRQTLTLPLSFHDDHMTMFCRGDGLPDHPIAAMFLQSGRYTK